MAHSTFTADPGELATTEACEDQWQSRQSDYIGGCERFVSEIPRFEE